MYKISSKSKSEQLELFEFLNFKYFSFLENMWTNLTEIYWLGCKATDFFSLFQATKIFSTLVPTFFTLHLFFTKIFFQSSSSNDAAIFYFCYSLFVFVSVFTPWNLIFSHWQTTRKIFLLTEEKMQFEDKIEAIKEQFFRKL